MRIEHRLGYDRAKTYDEQGSVPRVETVINDARDLKVYRPREGDESGQKAWRYLREGVADLHRRAEVSHRANGRDADGLAQVAQTGPLREIAEPLSEAVSWHGRRARGLNGLGKQGAVLPGAVSRGEFLINGSRNRQIRAVLYGATEQTKRERGGDEEDALAEGARADDEGGQDAPPRAR